MHSMSLRLFLVTLCLIQSLLSGAQAQAKVTHTDDFGYSAVGWPADEDISIQDNTMRVRVFRRGFMFAINGLKTKDMELQASVALVESSTPKDTSAKGGVLFWTDTDRKIKFMFVITPDGRAAVVKSVDGNHSIVMGFSKCAAIVQGLNKWNQLRVVTKGKHATFYVNGTKFGEIDNNLGGDVSKIGFVSGGADNASEKDSNVFAFKDLTITY